MISEYKTISVNDRNAYELRPIKFMKYLNAAGRDLQDKRNAEEQKRNSIKALRC